jgi:hypothetical protein
MTFRNGLVLVAVFLALAMSPSRASAQAWLPAQGDGSVSLLFSDTYAKYHFLPTERVDVGHIRSETTLLDVTYGLTDRVTVGVSLPLVASRYTGDAPHPQPLRQGVNPLDDGGYHATLQDFRFNLRYNVLKKRGLAVTPFVGSIVPSHDYEIFAHAAPGRDLKELSVGVSAARIFEGRLPGVFLQASYAYGIAQQILDISHNHSNLSLEAGYFVTPKFRLIAIGSGQRTHGGIDGTLALGFDPVLFPVHDQITRDNYLNLGGAAAYTLSNTIDVYGSLVHGLAAAQRNIQQVHTGLTVGLSWTFSTRRADDRAIASAATSLTRCVCEKGTK